MLKRKHKFDSSIIDYHDVLESSSIQGIANTVQHFRDKTTVDQTTVDHATIDPDTIRVRSVDHSTTDLLTVDQTPVDQPQDDRHASLDNAPALYLHGRPKSKAARTVQDGHSAGEEKIYDLLWKYSKPFNEDARVITIGYSAVAGLARLALTNCRANIFSLMEKLAIEEYRDHLKREARTYLVFSYSAILRRRKDAGLTHIIRTRGVVFVHPETGQPLTRQMGEFRRLGKSILSERSIAQGSTVVGSTVKRSVVERSERSIVIRSTPSYRINSFSEPTATVLCALLQAKLPTFDDDAVNKLWADCCRQVPDVTAEEVALLFDRKLPESQARTITNPVGFLVRAVAWSCTPSAIGELRQGRELPKDEPISIATDELEGLLDDPSTSPEMRELIELRLRQDKNP